MALPTPEATWPTRRRLYIGAMCGPCMAEIEESGSALPKGCSVKPVPRSEYTEDDWEGIRRFRNMSREDEEKWARAYSDRRMIQEFLSYIP